MRAFAGALSHVMLLALLFAELLCHRADESTSGPHPTIITAIPAKEDMRLIFAMERGGFHRVIPHLIDERDIAADVGVDDLHDLLPSRRFVRNFLLVIIRFIISLSCF